MRGDEEGTSSAIAFALAGVLFIAAISTVLVYANDRIPPPSKSQPHDELAAEARSLMYTVVLAGGAETWTGTEWAESVDDPAPNPELPGLRCQLAACDDAVALEKARLDKLALATPSSNAGTYHYEELRALFGMDDRGREFRITVVDATDSSVVFLDFCRIDAVLGTCVNPPTATRPAVAFLQLYAPNGVAPHDEAADFRSVRVIVHVFLACSEGACLA